MRFKVGQKVRVVKPYSGSDFDNGEIVEIIGIERDAYHGQDCYKAVSCENKDKDWSCLCEDEVRPINNGDKIKIMTHEELMAFMETEEVQRLKGENYQSTQDWIKAVETYLNSPVEEK